jgi:hypothetical protein
VEYWRGESVVDRDVAGVFVQILPTVDPPIDACQDEERSRIRHVAHDLQDLITKGLAVT